MMKRLRMLFRTLQRWADLEPLPAGMSRPGDYDPVTGERLKDMVPLYRYDWAANRWELSTNAKYDSFMKMRVARW